MIRGLRRFVTVRHNYSTPLERQRAQGLLVMIWAALVGGLTFIILQFFIELASRGALPTIPLDLVVGLAALVFAQYLIQRGRLDAAIWAFMGIMLLPLVPTTALSVETGTPIALFLPLVAAGVLLGRRSLLILTILFIITLIIHSVNQSQSFTPLSYIPADIAAADLINYGIFLGLSAIFLLLFTGSAERATAASAADIQQMKTVGQFRAALDDVGDENQLLTQTLETIRAIFGFELVQFYLYDEDQRFGRHLRLGMRATEVRTRVPLSETDEAIFTEAVTLGIPIIITSEEGRARSQHLIAPARESVTIALSSGGMILGVLDVQSEKLALFSENSIASLEQLAAQTAREIVQARRLDDLQKSLHDQEGIITRFLNQITELQQRSQSTSASTWARYLQGRGQAGFGFDYAGGDLVSSTDLPEKIRRAIHQGDIVVERENGDQVVNVPITIRDQVLGALTFNIPLDRPVTERQIEMLRTIANRLGVALESNRLLEQTQAQALRERKASQIGSTLLSATDVEAVLELAAENFNEALGAVRTRVYLEPGALAQSGEEA